MHLHQQNENTYNICMDETVIGWVKLREGDSAPILDCFLKETHRGQGHATQACNDLLEQLEKNGISMVSACCEIGNSAAIRLFARLGFELRSIRGEEMFFVAEL